ncbi:MAG: YggS family pyridoxal phosphate-dependent enzyme [Mesorhizobium sp.]|uniref:YggS family pyridoxal phosphate-dependent enzyme n=1 Tax=unclassified Mesorhizobium TaxID=325217 RepID=UPI000FCBB38B|nr:MULTISPECIES: YggS family pyridoxal phosphate-dependent enzyme [unclassified Mesorhizobium]RUV72853.1 YggS family pyridoxal phosphate-dependent enzyme [Mesorhizobium sp. M5C.F.Cr.IN.023.01.1.1]RWF96233.1 MAG: YggS family pyridoxal phosphate-dependent enzyme [Mesorhizobium sp.]RWI38659.1 MAG: YggS family pyridoxal phosphate-dependent enzyme [Mesorhizobium sp.]RWI49313.1 MAG: YggS family pyridoxal phosphate-dependent enzyme [Mesorhizobium sp.]RWI58868.1 MAG: YggS family pyridoxal phosphate-de
MASAVEQFFTVKAKITAAEREAGRQAGAVTLVAVSKTFDAADISPVIEAGQRIFGENRVQEAQAKWPALKEAFPDIELHLIGPLQSNKAKEAVALFDVIETVDREKIAAELAREIARQGRSPTLYVQVNTGSEPQKAGIEPRGAVAFVTRCRDVHGLAIEGLMCIPPADENPGPHFALLEKLSTEAGVEELSMGMSGDYETAIAFGATSVRVGSAIFGSRYP